MAIRGLAQGGVWRRACAKENLAAVAEFSGVRDVLDQNDRNDRNEDQERRNDRDHSAQTPVSPRHSTGSLEG